MCFRLTFVTKASYRHRVHELYNESDDFALYLPKADKISKVKIDSHIGLQKNMFCQHQAEMPHYFVTSATESLGKEELLGYIEEVNQEVNKTTVNFKL
jgi:GTP-binding protein